MESVSVQALASGACAATAAAVEQLLQNVNFASCAAENGTNGSEGIANANLHEKCLTSFDAGSLGFICLYFLLISTNWFPLMLFMTVLSTLAFLVLVFILPESPSWLLAKGRVSEAVDVLNFMGRTNGVHKRIPYSALF